MSVNNNSDVSLWTSDDVGMWLDSVGLNTLVMVFQG